MVFGDASVSLRDSFNIKSVMSRPPRPRDYPDAQAETDVELCALIIEQAVIDWIRLGYGKFGRALSLSKYIYRAEVESFFKSSWFEFLLEYALPSHTPQEVRQALKIGEPDAEYYNRRKRIDTDIC